MNTQSNPSDQQISITLPLRIEFKAIESLLRKKFVNTTINKTDAHGKVTNYFNILDIDLATAASTKYNLEIKMKLEALTVLFNHKDFDVVIWTELKLDPINEKLYVEAYDINVHGLNFIANNLVESVLNTFIYKKIINMLNVELTPIIKEKIDDINIKLASKMEASPGISILGRIEDFSISHFEIKNDKVWVLINAKCWGVISIEDFV